MSRISSHVHPSGATLPKLLVDFAKAGLSDPTLVRLDVETKVILTMLMMK